MQISLQYVKYIKYAKHTAARRGYSRGNLKNFSKKYPHTKGYRGALQSSSELIGFYSLHRSLQEILVVWSAYIDWEIFLQKKISVLFYHGFTVRDFFLRTLSFILSWFSEKYN